MPPITPTDQRPQRVTAAADVYEAPDTDADADAQTTDANAIATGASKVTMQQLADRLGLSKGAISQALNNTGRLKAETRQRVLRAAAQFDYRPNEAAKAISTGRFNTLALLLSSHEHRSPLSQQLLEGVADAITPRDLQLSLTRLPDEQLTEQGFIPKILRSTAADGLLINYTHHIPQEMIGLVLKHSVPAVWINSKQPANCVYADDFAAAARLTTHLIELGHTRIAYVDYSHSFESLDEAHYSTTARQSGYQAAMQDAGLTTRVIRKPRVLTRSKREEFTRAWLNQPDRPTAVIGYSEGTIMPVIVAALVLGIDVPSELSVASFDPRPCDLIRGPVTTMLQPDHQLGLKAVDMLTQRIARPNAAISPQTVDFTFDPGFTAKPPPNDHTDH